MTSDYERTYAELLSAPEQFRARAAEAVHWYRKWDRVLDDSRPPYYRWFRGGMVHTCHNALDIHVASGRGDQAALIYDSPHDGCDPDLHLPGAAGSSRPLYRRAERTGR